MPFKLDDLQQHNEDLLKLLTENLPDMLWVKDINGNYLYANEAICNGLLMAKDTKEPIGKNDVYFAKRERNKHKDNPRWHTFGELCANSDLIVIENNKAMKFEEYGNVKGKLLYLEVYKAPFYDENKNILGTVGAGRDITELKQIQLDLESLNNQLEQRVNKAVAKQQKQEQLMLRQSRNAAMGEMLESIAHQWRQPLNIIGLSVVNLETQFSMGELEEKEFHEKIDIITRNINYMSSTIDDFRKFLYSEGKNAPFKPKEVVDDVLMILKAQLVHYNIDVEFKPLQDLEFCGVQNEFKQVMLIILNNSLDAIKQQQQNGLIKKGKISISYEKDNSFGILDVCDNGGGIKGEHIQKVFDPYFSTKKELNGTGIGLYIAKNIIESGMMGKLSIKNVKDGTSCRIRIPLNSACERE
jgi:signal transduction histidine kinase